MKSKSRKSKAPNRLVAIVGPTATGKSDLAVALAKRFNGEIVSADSRQIYRGLNIGSGKITTKEMRGVRHHLLDAVSPNSTYSAARFKRSADRAIADIASRGKLPVIAGGTGYWIDAVLKDQDFPDVKPNAALRKKLAGKTVAQLFTQLKKLDPRRAQTIDAKNPARLVRAIEIAAAGKAQVDRTARTAPKYAALCIGLDMPDEKLKERIARRLQKRMKHGMPEESFRLHKSGISWKRLEEFGLEYRAMVRILRDEMAASAVQAQLQTDIWHFAKRQRTWFKRNKDIAWLDASDRKKAASKALKLVQDFLSTF